MNLFRSSPFLLLLSLVFPACSKRSSPSGAPPEVEPVRMEVNAPPSSDALAQGAAVYEQTCAVCHYDGSGSAAAPPLLGSSAVKESADGVILTILKGQRGKTLVNGRLFKGLMPAQNTLSDEEIASVVAFVRKQFGGVDEPVLPSDVCALR